MTEREHVKLLAGFFFISGAWYAFSWIVTGGLQGSNLLLGLLAGFYMVTGWKMQNQKQGASTFGIIASFLCLFSIPVGTALGIYGLWFYTQRQGKY